MAVPNKITLYRMVHWQNVEHILHHGMCCRGHELEDPNYINIGMQKLIDDRHNYPIPIEGAGNLGEYVPFYFSGHSPMLFLIKNGLSGVHKRLQEDVVFLVCNFETIKINELEYVFTDRNAKIAVANYFQNEQDFDKLDWESIRAKQWASDDTNLSRRDLKQAEFLVRKHVPVNCIHAIVLKTNNRQAYFEEMIRNLDLTITVHVDNNGKLYY